MVRYSTIRSAYWRLTGYPAAEYKRLLAESESWSTERLQAYRDEKVHNLIAHCYEHVPYYRKVMGERGLRPADFQLAKDLEKLPVLTKPMIREHQRQMLADNLEGMSVSWSKTGGTTGEPMRVAHSRDCIAWATMCYERGLGWGGWTVDRRRVRLFGGSLGIDRLSPRRRLGRWLQRDVFVPAFELTRANAPEYFERIERSGARFLVGYASAIYRLAILSEELCANISFDSVFPTAELLLPHWRETIERAFGCRVLPYYGSGEVASLGYYSDDIGAYKIPDEHTVIEIWKADDSTAMSGDGRFLITDLDNYAMPMIRYANGDAGKIAKHGSLAPGSCIERLDGRYNSLLMTDTGDLISGVIGTHVFRHFPSVGRYRIIQEAPLEVLIQVVVDEGLDPRDQRRIIEVFQKHLGSRMVIRVERVEKLPQMASGKSVFVINHCLEGSVPQDS